ncbi:hypothetical protein ACLOJK_027653 [Asimina triloba]
MQNTKSACNKNHGSNDHEHEPISFPKNRNPKMGAIQIWRQQLATLTGRNMVANHQTSVTKSQHGVFATSLINDNPDRPTMDDIHHHGQQCLHLDPGTTSGQQQSQLSSTIQLVI